MHDWIIDTYVSLINSVPALFVEPGSIRFVLIRAMFGLMILVALICVIAAIMKRQPFQAFLRGLGKIKKLFFQ